MALPPPSAEESRSDASSGPSLVFLATTAVASAAVAIFAYRYSRGQGRRSIDRSEEGSGAVATSSSAAATGMGNERLPASGSGKVLSERYDAPAEDENESLRRAMEDGDRDRVRLILRARDARQRRPQEGGNAGDNGSIGVDPSASPPPDPSNYACPICLNLLYKPCVNSCGHAFCFWCLHSAMSAVRASACPLCRNPFTQFAAVMGPLHRFLLRTFPEEMNRRAEEVRNDERQRWRGLTAPDVDEVGPASRVGSASRAMVGSVDILDLLCVRCNGIVSEPVVPACGHLICRNCISSDCGDGKGGSVEDVRVCPECRMPILDGLRGRAGELAVCSILEPLLAKVKRMDRKIAEAILEKMNRGSPKADEHPTPSAPSFVGTCSQEAPHPITLDERGARNAGDYIHMGIGCDGCGVFPMVGRAYKCLDCPDEVGFDLCYRCYSRGVHLRFSTGRFNQKHQATHRMQEREQEETILHCLRRMHPDLSLNQIMQLIDMHVSFGFGDEEDDRVEAEGRGNR